MMHLRVGRERASGKGSDTLLNRLTESESVSIFAPNPVQVLTNPENESDSVFRYSLLSVVVALGLGPLFLSDPDWFSNPDCFSNVGLVSPHRSHREFVCGVEKVKCFSLSLFRLLGLEVRNPSRPNSFTSAMGSESDS